MELSMGLQRIDEGVEREVRLLGVAGISFSDAVSNMVSVIKSDPSLVDAVRQKAFEHNSSDRGSGTAAALPSIDRRRARRGEVTPSKFYKSFILRLLLNAPGYSLSTKEALRLLEPMLRPHLKPADYATLPKTGVP